MPSDRNRLSNISLAIALIICVFMICYMVIKVSSDRTKVDTIKIELLKDTYKP